MNKVYLIMIGIDEAGRGAWAGSFIVAGVRFRTYPQSIVKKLADSKALTSCKRQVLADKLLNFSEIDIAYAEIKAIHIDQYGLTWAQIQAMKRVARQLKPSLKEEIIVDGSINYLKSDYPSARAIVKADQIYPSVMAASILAKVKRDQSMINLAQIYPNYGFDRHKGYGTLFHRKALKNFGALKKIHRFSYKPIAKLTKF